MRTRVLGALLVVVAVVGLLRVESGDEAPAGDEAAARTVETAALDADSCRPVDVGDTSSREHVDPAGAPPAQELYDVPLPAAGDHFGRWSPLLEGVQAPALDVRTVLHNLEHGAIVVWVDPGRLDAEVLDVIGRWRDQLAVAGFAYADTGVGVFVSVMPETVDVDGAVAYRAWGVALDCDGWDVAQADAFVARWFGSRGDAPEASLGPYPEDNAVLRDPRQQPETTTI